MGQTNSTNKRKRSDDYEEVFNKRPKIEPGSGLKRKHDGTASEKVRDRPDAPKPSDKDSMLSGFQKLDINNYMKESDKLNKEVVESVTRMDAALIEKCQRKGGVASSRCPINKPHVEMMGNLKCCLPLPDDRAMMFMQSFIKNCIKAN